MATRSSRSKSPRSKSGSVRGRRGVGKGQRRDEGGKWTLGLLGNESPHTGRGDLLYADGRDLPADRLLVDRQPLELGPFKVTPFLVDHSAFDAYAVLVEAGGQRLFYSGDLRAHGRKAGVFERLIAEPPTVDSLLLEGTRVLEDDRRAAAASEQDAEERAAEVCRATSGLVLALASSASTAPPNAPDGYSSSTSTPPRSSPRLGGRRYPSRTGKTCACSCLARSAPGLSVREHSSA
jgi:hypothetical protein